MAASDSCVSSLYAEATEPRASTRGNLYSRLVRSFAPGAWQAAEFLAAAISTVITYNFSPGTALSFRQKAIVSTVLGIVAAFSRARQSESSICNLGHIRETEAILRSTTLCQLVFVCVNLLLGTPLPACSYVLSLLLMMCCMIVVNGAMLSAFRLIHRAGYGADAVVIYGHPDTARRIASAMLRSPSCGFHPIAMIHDETLEPAEHMFRSKDGFCRSIPVSGGPLTSVKLNSFRCNALILAAPHLAKNEIERTADIARECETPIAVLSATFENGPPARQIHIDGLHLAMESRIVSAWNSDLLKRAMDVIIAALLIILASPVFLLIALCIKLDSRGPVLFAQKRVGRKGELFTIFKFRSMYADSPIYEASPSQSTDPRITRVGRVLRRTGLDETAQLLNVLLGEMSLVGPRPEMPFLVERHIQQHRPRLEATPGITGLWQLSTDRAYPIHQNNHYDLYYIRNRTFWMDAAILLHTLVFAMRGGV